MPLLAIDQIKTVGLAGAGAVGFGWAALLLARGYQVVAADPAEDAESRLRAAVHDRWPALVRLGIATTESPPIDALKFVSSLEEMAAASDLVQENAPEGTEVKRAVISAIDSALRPECLILSSSGGVPPSVMQSYCKHPERLLLGHPFHPAHIVPLVEVVGGDRSTPEAVEIALQFYRRLGKHPIHLKKERVGHLSNRLQFALLREASNCLASGVASAEDIDAAMRWGLGPRWALMGSLMTFNLAGGEGGLESLLNRFADDIQKWWDSLEATKLTPEVRASLVEGARQIGAGISNREWELWRDNALIDFFQFRSTHPYLTDTKQ